MVEYAIALALIAVLAISALTVLSGGISHVLASVSGAFGPVASGGPTATPTSTSTPKATPTPKPTKKPRPTKTP